MYLKKLELVGFKSFPEKSTFLFTEGITCIVGPNGCGKTNLLDALRWVLGEQKTSLLRGSKMEEVIFSGTRMLKPLGMSEVSLHMENRNGILPSQYSELAITRRLFRSGESEYLLNKVPCRLRDITDLFADTGLGSHAYAIIQQEMIDAILSDRAEERRFLFEEAAGITKYKQRRQAAERKLQATDQDLLRLQDILSEVTTRVNSLKRQVSKARRYQVLSEELKNWDLYNTKNRFDSLGQQKANLSLSLKNMTDEKLKIDSQLDTRFAELEEDRSSLTDLEHNINEIAGRVYRLSEQGHQLETQISVNREKKENLAKSILINQEEIDALEKRANNITQDKETGEHEISQVENRLAELNNLLDQAVTRQKEADDSYLQYRSIADEANSRLFDMESKISSGRTDSSNIDEQISDLQREMEQHKQRRDTINEEKNQRRQKITNLQNHIETARSAVEEDEKAAEICEKQLEESLSETDRLRENLSELSTGYEATLVRRNLLTEMVEHYEGFGAGVVAVFDVANRWFDVTGTVADFIHPHDGYGTAIEAALGEAAQYILCQNQNTAHEAIEYLKQEKSGRATFLVLEKLSAAPARPPLPAISGLIGWADNHVDYDDRYGKIPPALLGQTVICDDRSTAQKTLDVLPIGFRAVTLNGELFTNNGFLTGGASDEISLIGRKNEIKSINDNLTELELQIATLKDRQNETSLKTGEHRQSFAKAKDKIESDKDRLNDLIAGLKEEQFKINAADEVITSIDLQIDQCSQKLEKLKHRQYSLTLDYDQLDQEKIKIAGEVKSKKEHLEELENNSHEAAEEVNRLQMKRVEVESEKSQLESKLSHFDELLADIVSNIELRRKHILEAEENIRGLKQQMGDDEIRLKEIFDLRDRENVGQQGLRQKYDEINGKIKAREQQVKETRKLKEDIGEKIHNTQISMTEIGSKLEQLEERIRNEYELEISETDVASPNPELAEDQIKNHVEELKEKLRRMGIVNLLALEEYDEQAQRKEFLTKQLDDLIEAKGTLKTTISKINQTARTMFLDTLDKARNNFKKMYEELFTDGEADVFLEDPSDPLESRLEIISRPRGKRPLTITQLSGGERALTAISLLFALYMVKPSPFCFLDEIDAPLDDINVGRFLKIVKNFSEQTQFIIITHNKITMEAADTLYGVTMEEPGVSKVVSVRFKKDEDGEESLLDMHYAHDDNLKQTG